MTKMRCSIGILVAIAMSLASVCRAAEYPNKPIRILIGFSAGGGVDIPVRYIAEKLKDELKVSVVVENKPGAASMLAIRDVLAQPRDGYTLSACTHFDVINTLLYSQTGYKASDIVPITLLSRYDYALAVPADSKFKSLTEILDYAKANPGKLNFAHLGVGSIQNLLMKGIQKASGTSFEGIPFKGSTDAIREVMADRIDLFPGPPVIIMPQYEARKLKVIAVTGKQRLASAPDVPTLIESGVPINAYGWVGLCAGAGTPDAIVRLLNEKILPTLKTAGYRDLLLHSGTVPALSTPAEMQNVIDDTLKDAAPLIKEFNIKLD